jgi:dsRNA-specific ribonuclease
MGERDSQQHDEADAHGNHAVGADAANLDDGGAVSSDYKTLLQQFVQQTEGDFLEYVTVGESGPDHQKTFTVEARLNSNVIGRGQGQSKRRAEQNAARQALELFGVQP